MIKLALTPTLRTYDPAIDEALVMDSWCKAIKPKKPVINRPFTNTNREQFKVHRAMIELLIDRYPPVVAHPEGFPEQIYGWACGGTLGPFRVLHMAYTRGMYRRQGVLSALLSMLWEEHKGAGYVTYETKLTRRNPQLWEHLCEKYGVDWNPYIVAFSGG